MAEIFVTVGESQPINVQVSQAQPIDVKIADVVEVYTGGAVSSVNTKIGSVVLNPDDLSDTSSTNKFTSAADKSKLAGIEAAAQVNVPETDPVFTAWDKNYQDLTNKPTLGTAAATAATAYATAAQGTKADTAVQPATLTAHTTNATNPHSVTKAQVGLSSVPNTDFTSAVNANTAKISYTDATKVAGIAAGATANDTDANLKARSNHTGTQTASTISDFSATVANNSAVAANTAKVSYTDAAKVAGIEEGADVTEVTNVTAAGALMDSEVTNLAQVKAFNSASYATALGVDDNYVTDAEKIVIGDTSGSNTGDQDLSGKANLASPAFTGTPAAPTPTVATNTTQVATTAFVQSNVTTVYHGATAGTARPSTANPVMWVGTVTPTNASDNDVWVDQT